MNPNAIADCDMVTAWRRDDKFGKCQRFCSEINDHLLLAGNEAPAHLAEYIDEFEKLFQFNSLPSTTVVFRACPRWTITRNLIDGIKLQYPAFISTSTKHDKALQFFRGIPCDYDPVLLEMTLTESIPTIDANSRVHQGIGEHEFVLPRNLNLEILKSLGHNSFAINAASSTGQYNAASSL